MEESCSLAGALAGIQSISFTTEGWLEYLLDRMSSRNLPVVRRAARNRLSYLLNRLKDIRRHEFERCIATLKEAFVQRRDSWIKRNIAECLVLTVEGTEIICWILEAIETMDGLEKELLKRNVYSFCRLPIVTSMSECLKKYKRELSQF